MSETRPSPAPLTDSPWFWLLLFSVMGLVLLGAIAPKYGQRQQRLELKYQAQQEMARRQFAGDAFSREAGDEGSQPPPAPGELIIPLWPLAVLLVISTGLSAGLLWRGNRPLAEPERQSNEGAAP